MKAKEPCPFLTCNCLDPTQTSSGEQKGFQKESQIRSHGTATLVVFPFHANWHNFAIVEKERAETAGYRDPVLLHHPTRKSVGYGGAVCLRDGRFVYRRETDRFNAQSCQDFLVQLRRTSPCCGRRTVVIADNAKYHQAQLHESWRQRQAKHFTLDFLPSNSPELNPAERIWKLTRRKRLHNCYFPTLDQVVAAVEEQFDLWTYPNETLRRLCTIT